ncbi:MAG: MFS transporter [Desulfobacterales bacterium]
MNSATAPRPGRKVFIGLSSFEMIAMFRRALFYNFLAVYLRYYLGLSVTQTTLMATLPMAVNILFQAFVWGGYSDRHQRRRSLIITGELLACLATPLIWYLHRLTHEPLLAGYIIIFGLAGIEIFWSMSNIAWSALIADLYAPEQRSALQGRLSALGGVGRVVGVWTGGAMYDGLGRFYEGWGFYEGGLFFAAAGAMLVSILPLFMVPEGGASPEPKQSGTRLEKDADNDRRFIWFLAAMIFINFGRNSIAVIVPQYLMLDSGFDVSSQQLGYIVNTQSLAMILGGLAVHRLSTRLGDGNTLVMVALLAVIAMGVLALADNLFWIYTANFLRGLTEVAIMASAYALAAALIPAGKRGRRFGWFNATFFLSWGMAGTILAGPVADLCIRKGYAETLAFRISFVSGALCCLVGIALLGRLLYVTRARQRAAAGTG